MASDAKACFSFKVEYHAVIWYLYSRGKTGKLAVIRYLYSKGKTGKLADVYRSSAPSYAQVKF